MVTLDTAGKCCLNWPALCLCFVQTWNEWLLEAVGHCFLCRVNQTDLTGEETVHRHTPACV